MTDAFRNFIDDVDALRRSARSEAQLVAAIGDRLAILNRRRWLPPWARIAANDGYLQHLLYAAPDGAFSVVSLVWRPGQSTPIHNHLAWCVVGVYEGCECETRYRLCDAGAEKYLVECRTCATVAGEIVAMVPDGQDIHRVSNSGDELAVSIHVYGANLARLGSSIRECFDHLPVRTVDVASAWESLGS